MSTFKYINNIEKNEKYYETTLQGKQLLNHSLLNKGTAFTQQEREDFFLLGKLPPVIETLTVQVERAYLQFKRYTVALSQYIYLTRLRDTNETLFYALVYTYLEEMMPILYTPIVGAAIQEFSHEFRTPRGLYLTRENQNTMSQMLQNRTHPEIEMIVVTDGEGVLGIGDQGLCAIDIPIAKLMVYTLFAGIHPGNTLPIVLDVGTNNKKLLDDPFYLGIKKSRLQGKEYFDFVDDFVAQIRHAFPKAFIHWEDFGSKNAAAILNKYATQCCTFNDDIQGTAVVASAAVIAAIEGQKLTWNSQKIIIFGAGAAGTGIAKLLTQCMHHSGLTKKEIAQRLVLIDKPGLLTTNTPDITPEQNHYLYPAELCKSWQTDAQGGIELAEVVEQFKSTVLIGCSAVSGAFTQEIVQNMASSVARPIIMPLSNPTERAEATPAQLLSWTNNQAIVATGSPFAPVNIDGKIKDIPQCNNALVFPGIGLGCLVAQAQLLTDEMLLAASRALANTAPMLNDPTAAVLPAFSQAREVSVEIALAVAQVWFVQAQLLKIDYKELKATIEQRMWEPMQYIPIYKA